MGKICALRALGGFSLSTIPQLPLRSRRHPNQQRIEAALLLPFTLPSQNFAYGALLYGKPDVGI